MSLVERAPGSERIDMAGVVEPYRYGSLVRHTKRQLMTEQQNRTQNGGRGGSGSDSLSTPGFSYLNHQRGSLSGMTFDVSDSSLSTSSRHLTGDRASSVRENRSRSGSTDHSNESRSNSPWMTWSLRPSVNSTPNNHPLSATSTDNGVDISKTSVNNTSSTASSSAHDAQKTSRFVFGSGLGNLPSSSNVQSPGLKVADSTSSHSVVRRNVWRYPFMQQHQNADEPSLDNSHRQLAPSSSLRKYSSTTSLQLLGSSGAKSPSASMDIRPTENSNVRRRNRQNSVDDRMPSTVSHKMVSLIQNYERGAAAAADDNDDGDDSRLVRRQPSTMSSLFWMPPVYSTARELSPKNKSSSLMNLSDPVSLPPMVTTDCGKDETSGTTNDRQCIALALSQLDQALAGEPYSSLRVSNVSRPSAFSSTSSGQNGGGRKLLTYRQYVAEFQQRRPSDIEDRMWNTQTLTANGNASFSSSPPESIYLGSPPIDNERNANESNSDAICQSKINGGCLEFPFRVNNGSLTNVDAMKSEERPSPNWRDSRNPTMKMDRQPSIKEVTEITNTTQKPPLDTRLQQTVRSHVDEPELDAGATATAAPSALPWPTATSWNGPETPQYPPVLLMFRERTGSLKSDCTGDSGFGRSEAYGSSTAGDEVDLPNDALSPYSAASTSPISATSATFTSTLTARLSSGSSTPSTAAAPSNSDWREGISAVRHRNQTTSSDSWSAAKRRASLNLPIGKQTPTSSASAARPSYTSAIVNGVTSTTPKTSDMRRTSSPAFHFYDDYDNSFDKSPPPTTISIRRFGWRSSSEDADGVVPQSAQQKRYSFGILPQEGIISPEQTLLPSWPSVSNDILSGGDPHHQLQQQQVQLVTTPAEIGCRKPSPNRSHDECAQKPSTDCSGRGTLPAAYVERIATSLSRASAETQTQSMAQSAHQLKKDASQEKECGDGEKDSQKGDVKSLVISVDVEKKPLTGIGFSIEGGKGSLNGDRPIFVRKLFSDATGDSSSTECVLQAGDEIKSVNGTDISNLTRHEAWNFLKSLPDGTTALVVVRRIAE